MSDSTLKIKAGKGLLWSGISSGSIQFLNLVFGIFLARLLNASDYGMVGMLTIFSLIAGSLQDSGFSLALINKPNVTKKDYNAVFWFSSLMGIALYLSLFFSSPLLARFFHTPELKSLARYAFLGTLFSSFGIVPAARLSRNLKFRERAVSSITALLISGITGVVLAYKGFSYWGIATQTNLYTLIVSALNWWFSRWRPTLSFNFSPIRNFFGFSSKMLLTSIFTHINNNLFSVILGRFYNRVAVGNYNQANKWNTMCDSLIYTTINSVSQPVLAQVADDRKRQARIFRKILRITAFLSFPTMFGLSLVAPELITIAITEKWTESAALLRLLAIGGAFLPISLLYSNLLVSNGKSDIYMWNTMALGVLQVGTMLLLFPYGIRTMIYVYMGLNTAWVFVWHYFVHKQIGLSLLNALKDVVPYGVVSAGVMVACHFLTAPISNLYIRFGCKVALAILLYIAAMRLSGSKTYADCRNFLLRRKI